MPPAPQETDWLLNTVSGSQVVGIGLSTYNFFQRLMFQSEEDNA